MRERDEGTVTDHRRRFDAITLGEEITGRSVTIGEGQVMAFAGLTGDFHPLHVDASFAEATPFGQRIAHGLLTLSIGLGGLAERLGAWHVVAALGIDATRFESPVFFGDTVTPTGKVDRLDAVDDRRGIAQLAVEISSSNGVVVRTRMSLMVGR